jgi:Retroviral aspartyl protease
LLLATSSSLDGDGTDHTAGCLRSVGIVSENTFQDLLQEPECSLTQVSTLRAPYINVVLGSRTICALLDTGSDVTCISEGLAQN